MSARWLDRRLARLEREKGPDGCPVCGYAPGAKPTKPRGFIPFHVHIPGVTEPLPDEPPCPGCGRSRR